MINNWKREEYEEWKRQGFPPSNEPSEGYEKESVEEVQDLDNEELNTKENE